jgi:hypothetical protein
MVELEGPSQQYQATGGGMTDMIDDPTGWTPPPEVWRPETLPVYADPYFPDPYYPDPYAQG